VRFQRSYLLVIGVLAVLFILAGTIFSSPQDSGDHSYSQLLVEASAGRVVGIVQQGTTLSVTVKDAAEPWTVYVASESVNVYAEVCAAAGQSLGRCSISYAASQPDAGRQWIGLLVTSLLPVLLIGSFVYFMMRQQQRQQANRP
jgi:ATP-dependent Zn protease